jgi:hypothetical protein
MHPLLIPYSSHPHNSFSPAGETAPLSEKPTVPESPSSLNSQIRKTGVTNVFNRYKHTVYDTSLFVASEIFYS